jgi:hypothetical protein
MVKPGVMGPGIHQIGKTHLGNAPEALKVGMLNDLKNQWVFNGYKPINRVIK